MYLVDTNVLSAGNQHKAEATRDLARWIHLNSKQVYVSTITIAEIETGIARVHRTGSRRKAESLTKWLEAILHLYSSRIIPLDTHIARVLGTLTDLARSVGSDPGLADLAIAATASSRGYTVLTRNIRHFQHLPVPCHDPFRSLPSPI